MRSQLHRLGNSHAVVIPKPLLKQLGIERAVEVELVDDHIEVRKPSSAPRQGWADALSLLPDEAFEVTSEDRVWLEMSGPELPQ
jgi:antitoxin component of MazEF toxin-antitoxin module